MPFASRWALPSGVLAGPSPSLHPIFHPRQISLIPAQRFTAHHARLFASPPRPGCWAPLVATSHRRCTTHQMSCRGLPTVLPDQSTPGMHKTSPIIWKSSPGYPTVSSTQSTLTTFHDVMLGCLRGDEISTGSARLGFYLHCVFFFFSAESNVGSCGSQRLRSLCVLPLTRLKQEVAASLNLKHAEYSPLTATPSQKPTR